MISTIHNGLALVGFLLFSLALTLEVSPGSPCSAQCLNSIYGNPWSASDSYTNSSDITCSDAAYSNTQTGIHFKTCLDCLRTSTRGNLGETDAKWFIYNLRYALDTCLYSKPNPASTAATVSCATDKSCQRLQKSLTNGISEDSQTGIWSYCFADDGAFMGSDRDTCAQCLRKSDDQKYMANYLVALEAGCRQTPEKGTAIGINGTVFTSEPVIVVDPASLNQDPNSGSLPSPAIAGIAVGTGVFCIIAVCLLVVYCQREKRHPRWEDDWYYGQSDRNPQPSISLSMRKRRSHINYPSEKPAPGSNGIYYDSVESKLRLEQKHTQIVDVSKRTSSVATSETGGLPAHPAYNPYNAPSRRVRDLPPPELAIQRPGRTNTPDSFAEQAYLAAAADSARLAATNKTSPTASHHPSHPTPSPTSSRRASSLLSKMGLSPKFGRHQRDRPGLVANSPKSDPQISGPMMVASNEARFHDRTLAGPSVYAQHAPPRPSSAYENQYIEVPIKTSENHLYGM